MPSTYFSRLNIEFQSGLRGLLTGQQGGISSVKVLLGHGKSLFGNSALTLSRPFSTLGDGHLFLRPASNFTVRSDPHIVNQRRNLSVVGALSRAFSIPSVSGPSYQVCEYQIDSLLSDSTQFFKGSTFQRTTMAACGSRALSGHHYIDNFTSRNGHLSNSMNRTGLSYSNRSLESCRKATMSLRNREPSNSYLIYGYFIFDVARRSYNSNPLVGPSSKDFHGSSSACCSTGAAPDVSFDGSAREEQLASSAVSSDQYVLSSGSPFYFLFLLLPGN